MPAQHQKIQQRLKAFDFAGLFTQELMWNHFPNRPLEIPVDGTTYTLTPVAQRGMAVFECVPPTDAQFPKYAVRRKIDTQVSKAAREHIIIFHDHAKTVQVWQWVKRESGKHSACREQLFYTGQSGDALIQKIRSIAFSLDDEPSITETVVRVGAAFDVEKVTKKFYELFKKEHDAFLKFVDGIPDKELERWYVSVMLNRLMFIYFIQKKGFLAGDQHYLANKLADRKRLGKNKFYRGFLCPLFFEGFAKRPEQRSSDTNNLLGQVPYLNGGLFLKHQIEERHGKTLEIPDRAFDGLFDFFEQYDWHLDERPTRSGREINPDVLGYVFEKYINQREMGAYYTKEDITEYISKNTIVPALFDMARKSCKIAFEGEHSVWRLLVDDPDRYFHAAMRWGMEKDLPNPIALGLNDVNQRKNWNEAADPEYALETETWREVVTRRGQSEEIRRKVAAGEVRSINDLITHNLDIRRFSEEVIANSEGPELLRAFYKAIRSVSVLDPTCGSGAFLFASLNILERLYDTCLVRMQAFVDDLNRSDQKHSPEKFRDFRETLDEMNDKTQHPSPRYFILKSIILNNLYGVDLMEEATEICKLRLFLKLVAQVEADQRIEPLPDIDFNIRAGNTLVGFATEDELHHVLGSQLDFDNRLEDIKERAELAGQAYDRFRQMQTEHAFSATDFADAKMEVEKRLKELRSELDVYLAGEYGTKPGETTSLERFRRTHQPFHWFVEFYGIMKAGGFDAIVGNPPYVEYKKVKSTYTIRNYKTEKCGNLYPLILERSTKLAGPSCRSGFIIPMAGLASRRTQELRDLLLESSEILHTSSYAGDTHPSILFEGVRLRLSIVICAHSKTARTSTLYTTVFQRWYASERSHLFARIMMFQADAMPLWHIFPRLGGSHAQTVWRTLLAAGVTERLTLHLGTGSTVFYQEAAQYFVKASHKLPYFAKNGTVGAPPHGRFLPCSEAEAPALVAVLSSTLFYIWYQAVSDCYHLSDAVVQAFPCRRSVLSDPRLRKLGMRLEKDLHENAKVVEISTSGGDTIAYAAFNYQLSKQLIYDIDAALGSHYDFSAVELDFISNYDVKYRMGANAEEHAAAATD
jgi:hypothetical protein